MYVPQSLALQQSGTVHGKGNGQVRSLVHQPLVFVLLILHILHYVFVIVVTSLLQFERTSA